MNRRFAPRTQRSGAPSNTLASRLTTERLPLDLALSIAVEVIEAVEAVHQQGRSFGQLSAADFVVRPDGAMGVSAPSGVALSTDTAADTFAVGAVLYQLFTGLTPNQARAHLAVSPLHEVPAASRLNPVIDDTLEEMLSLMLDRDPARRPHSLPVLEALLFDVCESLELEPSRAAIITWASTAPPLGAVKPAQPPSPVVRHRPTYVAVLPGVGEVARDDDEDVDERVVVPGPLRFDRWAVAICVLGVAAFAMATRL